MARPVDTPLDSADLLEYIQTRDDFALELRLFREAKSLGFRATHGGSYQDPFFSKTRQFDVRALSNVGGRYVAVAIESKSLQPSYPLLVSQVPRASHEAFNDVLRLGTSGSVSTERLERARSLYAQDRPVGKSVSQVGRTREGNWVSSDADVYDKWMQAVSSALAWADDVASGAAPGNAAYVFLPLLVVSDGTLWAADYNDDGALAAGPNVVQELTLYLDRESPSRRTGGIRVSHLHICSETGANELLQRASMDCAWRDRLFGN